MSKSEKITQFVIVICIAAIITAVGNVMDGKHLFGDSLIGVAVLAGSCYNWCYDFLFAICE